MFELCKGELIDKENHIAINFSSRINPNVDQDECNIGYYRDENLGISFEFDVVIFYSNFRSEEKNRPCAYFNYVFIDLIVSKYAEKVNKSEDSIFCQTISKAIIENLNSAFLAYCSKLKPWTKDLIYRIIFLNSQEFVKISKYRFNYVDVEKIRRIFDSQIKKISEAC
jgi:hypothetical protein